MENNKALTEKEVELQYKKLKERRLKAIKRWRKNNPEKYKKHNKVWNTLVSKARKEGGYITR